MGKAFPLKTQLAIFALLDRDFPRHVIAKRLSVSEAVVLNYERRNTVENRRKLKLQIEVAAALTQNQHERARSLIGRCLGDPEVIADKLGIPLAAAIAVVDLEGMLAYERSVRAAKAMPRPMRESKQAPKAKSKRKEDDWECNPAYASLRDRWNECLGVILGIDNDTADEVRRVIWKSEIGTTRSRSLPEPNLSCDQLN